MSPKPYASYDIVDRRRVLALRSAVAAIPDNTTLTATQTTSVKKLLLEVTSELIDTAEATADNHENALLTSPVYRHEYFLDTDLAYKVRFLYTMDAEYALQAESSSSLLELLRKYGDVADAHNKYDINFIADGAWLLARWAEYVQKPGNLSTLSDEAIEKKVVGGVSLTGRPSWGISVTVT